MNTKLSANQQITYRAVVLVLLLALIIVASTRMRADVGVCGGTSITLPFTDVMASPFFCQIAAAYFSGLTNGTSATTYSPTQPVPREQMAAFITRTMDQSLKRGSKRAVAQQWWRPTTPLALFPFFSVEDPARIAWDGIDLWVTSNNEPIGRVTRVRANDGTMVGNYFGTELANVYDLIFVSGYVFVTLLEGPSSPGKVYRIYPFVPNEHPQSKILFEDNTGPNPMGITFDGTHLWTANNVGGLVGGSITRISLSGAETTFTAGFTAPADILWDGDNLWVADFAADRVRRVDHNTGAVLQSITVGNAPRELLFDGANLWVSNFFGDSVTVIRAVGPLRGTVLQTLTGNGLNGPAGLAFDGEHVLVCNFSLAANSVSLFKAADFTPVGNFSTTTNSNPVAACSDGLNFWIVRQGAQDVVRF